MVKEVEFSNFLEILDKDYPYSDEIGNPIFDGRLDDSGKSLTIIVGKPIPIGEGVRQLSLYFGNTDFDVRLIDYTLIEETPIDDPTVGDPSDPYNRRYKFDLSKVLEIPRKVYNSQGTSEITIELYTYEANLTTDYGTKRLSVPYTIWSDTKYEYDNSTDGIYRLYMVDYAYWDPLTSYGEGDIIYVRDHGLYISLSDDNIGNDPTLENNTFWSAPTEEERRDFAYGVTKNQPINTVISDMLITRYAKYYYIFRTLKKMDYKKFDNDIAADKTMLLQLFREQALFHLLENKPISAAESLQQLKLAYGNMTITDEVRTYNIKYTL